MYIPLYTKYRPQTFDEVVEQKEVIDILKNQLSTNTIRNAYLFTGTSGSGKTTLARILAKEINKGKQGIVEMDAASHNGADDVRAILEKSNYQSFDAEYRIFLLDECVTGDVEILTDSGFKRFDMCNHTEKVAQYTDDGCIEFVTPLEWIQMPYVGDLVKWNPRNWCSIKMTPHHVQPLYYHRSDKIREFYIKDVKFHQGNNLIVAGRGVGKKKELTVIDRLVIASQADGTIQGISTKKQYVRWSIQLTKQRKIDRFIELCKQGNIEFWEIAGHKNTRRFTYKLPMTSSKYLSTHFDITSFDYTTAREFIKEVAVWDGYITEQYFEYISTIKENCDFVSAVAFLGGYSARQGVRIDNRKSTYKNCHRVFMYDKLYLSCEYIGKTITSEKFDGDVYCVRVPSQKIVVRVNGFVFVTGNCHQYSTSAFSVWLKTLEEPPAKTIFMFCTTDPQKIPATILNRVQRFDLRRISYSGIVNRLSYIVENEKRERSELDISREVIEFIAKLSKGGMRDAITMLDKCIAYKPNIGIEDVSKILGSVNYDVMFDLYFSVYNGDEKRVVEIIENIYNNGNDLKQLVSQFADFVADICKYKLFNNLEYIGIPDYYREQLNRASGSDTKVLKNILKSMTELKSDIKYESSVLPIVETEFLLLSVDEEE